MNPTYVDIVSIIAMMYVLPFFMKKHGTWKRMNDFTDFGGWAVACTMLYAVGKLLWLLPLMQFLNIKHTFPLDIPIWVHAITGILSVLSWFALIYWRIPGRILGRNVGQKQKQ